MRREILFSQTKVETDREPSKLADRQELVIFRQQKGTTAKSTYWGGDYPVQTDFAENTNVVTAQHESPPARRLRLASNGKGRHRLTRTSSMTPVGRVMIH